MKIKLLSDILHLGRVFKKDSYVGGDAAQALLDSPHVDNVKKVPDSEGPELGKGYVDTESRLSDAVNPQEARWIEEAPGLVAPAHPSVFPAEKEQIRKAERFDSSGDHNDLADAVNGLPAYADAYAKPAADVEKADEKSAAVVEQHDKAVEKTADGSTVAKAVAPTVAPSK